MLNKSSIVPIYHQLKTLIQNRILSGEYAIGAQLPSERELCDTYAISRMTVRQAIIDLVNDGLVKRERGRGSYVAKPKIEQGLQLTSFTEEMRRRNMNPGTRLLSLRTCVAEGRSVDRLQLSQDRNIHCIVRLRLADGEPMAIETCHIPVSLLPALSPGSLEHGSLYATLRETGLCMAYAEQTVEASLAKSDEAELLNIKYKAPVLLIERTTYLADTTPLEYVRSVYRADRYKFSLRLTNPEG
jgi:GntR family transcriptional regulator